MAKSRVLVVDDEEGMLEVCSATLRKLPGAEVFVEQESPKAAERIAKENFDLLILDIRLPGLSGIDLLHVAREQDPNVAVLMMTAFPRVESAVECMKLGAADYLTKPFLPEDLLAAAKRLLESKQLRDENRLLQKRVEHGSAFGEMIGSSAQMQEIDGLIDKFARADVDVLILGETGTGKELVARSIHERSWRRDNRYMPVDCGAIPEDLLESELFGHERGAFTGAESRSLGLLEMADKGTFFLDEVGELSPRLQSKLLRTLQERRLRRVGGTEEIEVDVRVISASSRNLEEDMRHERFRSDLFYRINVACIVVPPLRSRTDDVPLLVDHFIKRYAKEMRKDITGATPDVLEILSHHPWPGNVRQLQNTIRRALAMTNEQVIDVRDLPDEIVVGSGTGATNASGGGFFGSRDEHVAAFERRYLTDCMTRAEGNMVRAASQARLPRGTLYRLLAKYDLKPRDFRD